MPEAISLKFGMWSTEVGGNVHSKLCLVSSRQHRATEVRKLRFLSSCQYTHGVARRLLGPHDTTVCLDIYDCAHVAAKATRVLNMLCRHLFGCSLETKCCAFSALVLPILEYA